MPFRNTDLDNLGSGMPKLIGLLNLDEHRVFNNLAKDRLAY
ncbi:Uncharacterised protein [Pseudomonas aeruginosa]|nr:Uncharacterised protein [Pseudomonas aeruginosa]